MYDARFICYAHVVACFERIEQLRARLEKVWSCVIPWSVRKATTTSECKSGPSPVAGRGGGSSGPSELPLGTAMEAKAA